MSQGLNPQYSGKSKKSSKQLSDSELKAMAMAKHEEQFAEQAVKSTVPTEIVELPSEGRFYPDGHPLKAGKIEMKYMTAKDEDILTNQTYIKNGVVLDKLFQSLIVTKFDYNDLLICDKNAIMVAARVLGYGKDYGITVTTPSGEEQHVNVDLTQIDMKPFDWDSIDTTDNSFEFELPVSKRKIKFKLLTQGVQKKIDAELRGLKKLKKGDSSLTTTLKHTIISVDGDENSSTIRKFVDNELFAIDSRALRLHIKKVTPDLDFSMEVTDEETGDPFRSQITIGLDLFWPDVQI
jgi:hypothetical protein